MSSLARWYKRPFRNSLSGMQLVEQRLGLLQIGRVEAFGEPPIDRSEQLASLLRPASRQSRARRTSKLEAPRFLLLRNGDSREERFLGRRGVRRIAF